METEISIMRQAKYEILSDDGTFYVIVKKYIKHVKNNPLTPFDKGEMALTLS